MDLFILILRLIFAGVFATAAIAKAADIEGSKRSLKGYGIPESTTLFFSIWLIAVELILSVGFLFVDTAWGAAAAAVILLAIFTGFLAPRRPPGAGAPGPPGPRHRTSDRLRWRSAA